MFHELTYCLNQVFYVKESTVVKISFLTFATNLYSGSLYSWLAAPFLVWNWSCQLYQGGLQAHWHTGTLGQNLTVEEGDEGLGN